MMSREARQLMLSGQGASGLAAWKVGLYALCTLHAPFRRPYAVQAGRVQLASWKVGFARRVPPAHTLALSSCCPGRACPGWRRGRYG